MNQPLPLVEQLKNLEHLQELDLKIDSLKKSRSTVPAGLKALDESLNKLKSSLNAKNNAISEVEKTHRQTQAALELNRDPLARASTKLEAVHNSQEFQAANKEIEQLKKLNVSLEDQDKKSLAELEIARKDAAALEEQFQKVKQERDAQGAIVSGQESQFNGNIDSLTSERTKYTSQIEPKILTQYERVRSARAGLGIVPAVGGRCKGCNMMVPPQLYNEIHRGTTLHSCPSCHRILFVPAPSTPAESKSETSSSEK